VKCNIFNSGCPSIYLMHGERLIGDSEGDGPMGDRKGLRIHPVLGEKLAWESNDLG
jgi:hypothetical protein